VHLAGDPHPDEDAVFDDLKIRNKLILLLAGPLLITLLLSALGARDRQSSAADSRKVERLVSLSKANSDVVDALQQESLYSSAFVGADRSAWSEELASARKDADAVIEASTPRLQDLGDASAGVTSTAALALGAIDKLAFFRDSVDQGFRPDQVNELVVNYAQLQDTFLAVNTNVGDTVTDPEAAAELRGASALASYKSAIAIQGALLSGASERGSFGGDETFGVFRTAVDAEQNQLTVLNSISGLGRKGAVRDAMATDASTAFELVRDQSLKTGATGDLPFDGSAITGATGTVVEDLHTVESDLFGDLIDSSQSASASAAWASNLFLVAAAVSIIAAGVAALVLGRRITQPLSRLTEAADRLSQEQMPRLIETLKNPSEEELGYQIGAMRPIEISSNDEIGRLARSFNEVQRVAGEVAAEQAVLLRKGIGEMFVNLARRNQALLDRQIEFIDELERGEEDPDQLENLYRLDHLATRMRRNAESLLVLAGAEPPRRRGRPAPLANVVRAALAEVEDFGRIELLSFDEVLVASNAAADLAHLLSELMENATNFSPPETRVEVVGHKTKADGYVVSVTDHGIGMSADQIGEANDSLAKPPLVGLAMSRSLGFIVVGRLAVRHSIAVRMMPSAAGGVTAVVSIPPSLVVDTPGGMADADPHFEAPARLKPVLDSSGAGRALGSAASNGAVLGASMAVEAAPAIDTTIAPLTFEPLGGTPAAPGPVTWEPMSASEPVPSHAPDPSPLAAELISAVAPEDAALAAGVDEAVSPAMPAALSFASPPPPPPPSASPPPSSASPPSLDMPEPMVMSPTTSDSESAIEPGQHLDGPPPQAPASSRPFFLEDADPPRRFGAIGAAEPAAAPLAPPAPAPRLFGGPPPAAAPPPPDGAPILVVAPDAPGPSLDGPPAPPPRRDTAPPRPPVLDGPPPLAPRSPVPASPPRATPAEVEADLAAPQTTTAGLAKRVPRSAGATRAIPGSETERNVSATRRSPEEIRNMLSQHSAGRQRAQTQEPVPAGAPEEREVHE